MGTDPKFTPGEVAQIAWYTARMAKRGIASQTVYQGDLERKVDRIIDAARERTELQEREAARRGGKRGK